MRVALIVVAILLFAIWLVGIYTFDMADVIHAFLIGAIVLLLVRFIFFKRIVK